MATASTQHKVLLVDDEPNVTASLRRHLRRHYEVLMAHSGQEGLGVLEQHGEQVAVVVSDMRMPQMNGATFLERARQRWPDATRILLTGYSDADSAIKAVNQGQIFRFLTKPCPQEEFLEVVASAARRHDVCVVERDLLEKTLKGSIKALSDVLALALPDAFGRASRIKERAVAVAVALGVEDSWELEVAALLSQIGAVVLPPETASKLYNGHDVSADEQAMVARVPKVGADLLRNIPRMEKVCAIIAAQSARLDRVERPADVPLGARILKIVLDHDMLLAQQSEGEALDLMLARKGFYDADALQAFAQLIGTDDGRPRVREVELYEVAEGMVLAEDIRGPSGMLLVARGYSVTNGLVQRLMNLSGKLPQSKVLVYAEG